MFWLAGELKFSFVIVYIFKRAICAVGNLFGENIKRISIEN